MPNFRQAIAFTVFLRPELLTAVLFAPAADPVLLIRLGLVVLADLMIDVLALKALNQLGFLAPVLALLANPHMLVRVEVRFLLARAHASLDKVMHENQIGAGREFLLPPELLNVSLYPLRKRSTRVGTLTAPPLDLFTHSD